MRDSTLLRVALGLALVLVPSAARASVAKGLIAPTPSRIAVLYADRLIPIEQFSIVFADSCESLEQLAKLVEPEIPD